MLNQQIVQLFGQVVMVKQLLHDTHVGAVVAQKAALPGVAGAATVLRASSSVAGSVAASSAAVPAVLPPKPRQGAGHAATAADRHCFQERCGHNAKTAAAIDRFLDTCLTCNIT